MKRNSLKVTFLTKKNQLLKNGEAAVSLRITVNGERVELRTKMSVNPDSWSQAKECSRAKDKKSRELNDFIEKSRYRITQIFNELDTGGKLISAEIIKNKFLGTDDESRRTLLTVFHQHNEDCRKLIGIDYVDITIRRYESCCRYLGELIKIKYQQDDLMLHEINTEFVRSFEIYLKTEKKCQQNTVIRYMKCFKKIINMAIANEWMTNQPFAGIRFQEKEVIKEFLTKEEIEIIMKKEFALPRIELVRDVFIFCVFSGLAFIDAENLRPEHIVKDNNGSLWIRKCRQKTNNMCNIPLLEIPRMILEKYKDYPICVEKGVCLPVTSNQKMNSYLKEISDFCGIKKNLTTHTARYTFASVVLLANDVSLINAAKMLGHSDTRMTQHYAKVLDSSIMRDMEKVKGVFTT